MKQRLLFLCAQSSVRSRMAESILAGLTGAEWNIWSSHVELPFAQHLVQNVLLERNIPLLEPPQTALTIQGQPWDEVVILCSGTTDF